MYTRATSIRSNFANASLRHHHHHINQNYNQNTTIVSNNYYGYLNAQHGNPTNGGGVAVRGKRYSSGDLELKPTSANSSQQRNCTSCTITTAAKDSNRKIVFQPIRTASLKHTSSVAQNGPLLACNGAGSYPETDLCDAPLLSRAAALDEGGSIKTNVIGSRCVGAPVGMQQHSCTSGVCLNENCPGIMFEDVDL